MSRAGANCCNCFRSAARHVTFDISEMNGGKMTVSRRVALVTGARRGIGRGICFALAAAGFDLAMLDLEEDDAARETMAGVRERGGRALFVRGDIADLGRHDAATGEVYDAFGTIDCLVNNAGVSVARRGDLLEVTPESFDRVVGITLRGTSIFTQAVAKRMVAERRDDAPPRAIVTISSVNAWLVGPDRAEYCIAKSGLTMMNKLFAVRLAAHRIHTYEVRPGIIET